MTQKNSGTLIHDTSILNNFKDHEEYDKKLNYLIENTRAIIGSIKEGIIIYGKDLHYKEWNSFMENISGLKKDDIIGKHINEISPFFTEDKTIKELENILNGGPELIQEINFKFDKIDLLGTISCVSKALLDGNKNIIGILSIVSDITESKKIEEVLNTAQSSLLAISDSTTDAIYRKDLDGKYTFVNKAAAKFIGKSKEEIIGKDDIDFFPEYYANSVIIRDNQTIESGHPRTYEEKLLTSDNKERIFHATKGPLFDTKGRLSGIFGISRDITEQKKTEIELIRLNRTLRMITNCSQIFSQVNTEKELITKACEAIVDNGGYLMCWIGFIDEKDNNKTILPTAQAGFEEGYLKSIKISCDKNNPNGIGPTGEAIRTGKPSVISCIQTNPRYKIWKDEAIKRGYNSSIALPIKGNGNIIIGAISVYSDEINAFSCEEVKLLDELSCDLSRNIQSFRVKEEKDKLDKLLKKSEIQLQIRQRMDSLSTLAAGIGHDFNNLLAGIMGYLELLSLEQTLSEQNKEYIKNALISCNRAADLIKQLQNLSANSISEKTIIDIYEVIAEVFNLLGKTTNKIVEKIIDLDEGEFYINGNTSELHQVFLNLGTNAFKAIDERGCKYGDFIKISAKNYKKILNNDNVEIPEGDYVYICFEDNGKGMSEDVLNRAFDAFFTTRKKSGQRGQGLGLAMVYNIITRNHKGYIFIESKEGLGAKINIYLPKAIYVEKTEDKEIITDFKGNETILVIDDEEFLRNFMKQALEMNNYKVLTAKNGEEGLDMYIKDKNGIDLVILDLTMPIMSGQTVLEKMLEVKDDVIVIIASGQSDEALREGILLRAKGFLHKPYGIKDLYEKVKAALVNGIKK